MGGVNYVAIILVQKSELLPHFYSVVAYNMISLKIAFTVDSCPSATRIGHGICNADTGPYQSGADIEGCGAADLDNYVDCDNVDVNDNHYNVVLKTKENYCGNYFTQIPCIKHFQINFHYTRMTVAFVRSNVKGMKHKTFENVFHSRQSQSPGS